MLSTDIRDREFTKFREPASGTAVSTIAEDRTYYKISIRYSSTITYVGENVVQNASLTSSTWRVSRILIDGQTTSTMFLDNASFSQQFDDPHSLFTPPISTFTYSTSFDGLNDYVAGGDIFNYEHSQQFSVSLWVKANNFASIRMMIGNVENTNLYGWRIGVDTSGYVITQTRVNGGSYGFTTYSDVPLTAMTWHHVVMTWAGGSNNNQARVFVDGVQSSIVPINGSMIISWTTTNSFFVGAGNANYFSGNIFQVTLWNKQLLSSDVVELYNGGVPVNPTQVTYSANLINYYKMGDNDIYPTIFDNQGSDDLAMTNMTSGDFEMDVP